ncbi:MAG: TCR/Tet family MFS transporter [Phenylobacterium sp.]|uniref:TCR/Tet family MFS transporter n=1 Tax=Phenylobacterium sp. TaxID=1871053 RepID=UPI002734A3B9|nr:TCR/Tet family MFS transporter [Phenylobacterium sp.]MDP3747591.1 TCR/Tet family MFS transporter [Phenylobacterium sp.]
MIFAVDPPPSVGPHARLDPRRRAGLGFIAVTICLDVVSHSIVYPVLPKLVEELLGGDLPAAARWVGLLVAAWSVAQFFAAPVIGMLSDRFGRRPVILISVFGLSIDLVIMALAPNLAWLLIGRLLCGLTAGSYAAAMAYVADITPPEDRAKSYGWLNAAAWTGVILGPALGGVLGSLDPRAPFWAAAAVALANGIYGFFVLPESLPADRRTPMVWRNANPWGSLSLLASRQGLMLFAIVLTLLWLAIHALHSVFVLYTDHRYAWSTMQLGVFFSVLAAVNIVVQTQLAGRAAKRLGERRTVLAGLAAQVLGFTAVGLAPGAGLFWIANLPIALGNVAGPSLQSMMTARVEETEQGRLQGAMGGISSLTGLFGPILFTQAFAWAIAPGMPAGLSGAPILLGAGLSAAAWLLIAIYGRDVPARDDTA